MPTAREDVLEVLFLPLVKIAIVLVDKDLREADDGVQRSAQLVAHVGEEGAFCKICDLGLLGHDVGPLGCLLKLDGSVGYLLLEVFPVFHQFLVADMNLRKHVVETVNETSYLIRSSFFRLDRIVLLFRDDLHRPGQGQDRFRDDALELRGEEIGHDQ